jgi:hypothetical protein
MNEMLCMNNIIAVVNFSGRQYHTEDADASSNSQTASEHTSKRMQLISYTHSEILGRKFANLMNHIVQGIKLYLCVYMYMYMFVCTSLLQNVCTRQIFYEATNLPFSVYVLYDAVAGLLTQPPRWFQKNTLASLLRHRREVANVELH